ncbi:MAG: hypothetical protein EH225_03730 [Calditrichaeota bacterium]|nr:hypothetical protein [Calditrichota bacterium]RQW06171.1 MAG: hypothetical protein EH225_03730 [Calditrichota bacterium]
MLKSNDGSDELSKTDLLPFSIFVRFKNHTSQIAPVIQKIIRQFIQRYLAWEDQQLYTARI